jgi:linoleate 10R-lipoxygenase
MLTKLLFRHLPDHYPTGSTYAHFPFMVPAKMKVYAQKLPGDLDLKYDWNRPAAPAGPTVEATMYSEVQHLLENPALFTSGVEKRLEILTGGVPLNGSTLVGPSPTFTKIPSNLIYTFKVEDILTRHKPLETTTSAFERITEKLITQKASKGASPHLDLVREVINLVPVHWLSNNIVR